MEALFRQIIQRNIVACEGDDMGDAIAHLPSTDDAYGSDRRFSVNLGSFIRRHRPIRP